jgi:formate dehydrogenase subunit beta
MTQVATRIPMEQGDLLGAVRGFLKALMDQGVVDAVLTPTRLPFTGVVMQSLIVDSQMLDKADPLAPIVPLNGARVLAPLTRDGTDRSLAAVLRPCEIRAFVELVKLKQAKREDLLLIGLDCLGRYETGDFLQLDGEDTNFTLTFYRDLWQGKGTLRDGRDLAQACMACEYPLPEGVDLRLCLVEPSPERGILMEAGTQKGEEALAKLGLKAVEMPAGLEKAAESLIQERIARRDQWIEEIRSRTEDIEGLMEVLGNCINCYNCRVVCPVCYCRECVFVTDTFQHESERYFRWAEKKGMLKMPPETFFYHLTRMQHMSMLCVGCGQCSSVCPSDIPVAQLFRSVALQTQRLFDYRPGRDLEEAMPLSVFHEDEFQQVGVG